MKVRELIAALQAAKDPEAEVIVTDTQGSFETEIFVVDEDSETVNIVLQFAGL